MEIHNTIFILNMRHYFIILYIYHKYKVLAHNNTEQLL
jgi:hypothetical protein